MNHPDAPLLTVVLFTFNQQRWIGKALDSVLAQGIDDMEILVLDDDSLDDTLAVAREHAGDDPRVRLLRNDHNLGQIGNANKAWRSGRGRYLVLLGGDDFLYPGHLRRLLDALETHPRCALAYSPCYWVDEQDRVLRVATHPGHPPQSYAGGRNEAGDLLAHDNYITPSAAMFRRAAVARIGDFDPTITTAADWDLFVRIALHHPDFAFVATPGVAYRLHDRQVTRRFDDGLEPLIGHIQVIEKALASGRGEASIAARAGDIMRRLDERAQLYIDGLDSILQMRIEALRERLERLDERQALPDEPLVSVIVPTWNRPELLQDALSSLVAQSYPNWEAVVVNDAGVDVEALVAAADPHGRIRPLRHATNQGLSAARNTGIRLSRGEILCYLDDDDRFLPDHLETVVAAFREHPEVELVYTEAEYVTERIENGKRIELDRATPFSGLEYSLERLHVSNYIPVNTWAHRRSLLKRIEGGFDTSLPALEDWDMLLRLARATVPRHLPCRTVEVRVRPGVAGDNMSQREKKDFPALYEKLYRRYPLAGDNLAIQREQALNEMRARAADEPESPDHPERRYAQWLERHALSENDAQFYAERMICHWLCKPAIHLVLTHVPGQEGALADTLDALGRQLYAEWGLSILTREPVADVGFAAAANVEWLQYTGELDETLNELMNGSQADWFLLIEAGDQLAPDALFLLADHANRHPRHRLVYFDEDRIDRDGKRYDPLFKPDINRELLRATPYIGQAVAFDRRALLRAGGVRAPAAALIWDATLRLLDEYGEEAIGHVPRVVLSRPDRWRLARDEEQVVQQRRAVLQDHLHRNGIAARIEPSLLFGAFFVDYQVTAPASVSIIIPVRDRPEMLRSCLESLFRHTDWDDYEILIVDNDSQDPRMAGLFEELTARHAGLRVLSYPGAFDFAAINNLAAAEAEGDYLLFLNNDTHLLQNDWLRRMVALAQQDAVGIVGARLVHPDSRVQHAGLVLGLGGIVGSPFVGEPLESAGYMGRAQLAQNYSAVSAACMLVEKALFERLGGFDADRFPVLYGDVDLCLRAAELGRATAWTPHATLLHRGGATLAELGDLGRIDPQHRQRDAFLARWRGRLGNDPAWNRNLSLAAPDARVEVEIDAAWDTAIQDRPRLLAFPLNPGALGDYRARAPLRALEQAALARVALMPDHEGGRATRVPTIAELERLSPDSLYLLHGIGDLFLDWLPRYRKQTDAFLVAGLDDNLFAVPEKNSARARLPADIDERVRATLPHCHRLIVTTDPLVEVYAPYVDDIQVVPNHLVGANWLGLESQRRVGDKPRVGWAGAQQHLGDLEWLAPVIETLADEVDWVFMGMCPQAFRPWIKEFHKPVHYARYPEKLARLNLDLAIAPLEINAFNECKSDLRLLEYGVLGWPVLASDIHPYRNPRVTTVANDPKAWIAAIREHISEPAALARQGNRLRDWVIANRLLENNTRPWLEALFRGEVLKGAGASGPLAGREKIGMAR